MKQTGTTILGAIVFATTTAAGQAVDIASQSKDKQAEPVVVRGCLAGSYLIEVDRNFLSDDKLALPNAGSRVRLVGSRSLMRQLREHEGRFVEVSGTIKNPPRRMVRSTPVGKKGRITIGKGSEPSGFEAATTDPLELRMEGFRPLDNRCP